MVSTNQSKVEVLKEGVELVRKAKRAQDAIKQVQNTGNIAITVP